MGTQLAIDVPIEDRSYLNALEDFDRYYSPCFLVKCNKTGKYHAWNYCTKQGILNYKKSFTILKEK